MINDENSKNVKILQDEIISIVRTIDKIQVLEFFKNFIKESWRAWK